MPTLYGFLASPPSRAVLLTAKAVGVELDMTPVNPMAGETRTPEFMEMNPQHTIPVLDDDGFVLTESRAIMCYLVDKFGQEDDPLYPKDSQQRAKILQRLMFDQGSLFNRIRDYFFPFVFAGSEGEADEKKLAEMNESMGILDKYLDASDWVAGENMTIADIAVAASISTAETFGADLSSYPNISRWLEQCKSDMSGYEDINQAGLEMIKSFMKS